MTETYFLPEEVIPPGFSYPREFEIVVDLGLVDFLVWNFVDSERATYLFNTINISIVRYIPFAEQRGSDDVACWDVEQPGKIFILENSAPNNETPLQKFDSFLLWLSEVFPQMLDHIEQEVLYA